MLLLRVEYHNNNGAGDVEHNSAQRWDISGCGEKWEICWMMKFVCEYIFGGSEEWENLVDTMLGLAT